MLRIAFVVTLAATGCCPSKPSAGDPCHVWQPKTCVGNGEPGACGLNGYSCRDGKWHEDFTYCNPPALPPVVTAPALTAAPVPSSALTAPTGSAAQGVTPLAGLVGLTLAEAVKRLGLAFDDLLRHDEPPGKLRSVSIPAEKNNGVALQLYLVYQAADGMDAERVWPAEKIGRLKVSGVTRQSQAEDGGTKLERAGGTPEP